MQKKTRKKLVIILSVVIGILLVLLIAGYIIINTMFSMFSDSFTQVTLQDLEKEQVTEQATPTPDAGTESTEDPQQAGSETNPEGLEFSAEKSQEMMDSVSFGDKVSVMTILSENLSAEEYKEMLGMLSGGITSNEINRAKEILRNSLSPEDKQTIKDYYSKYSGLLE